jgi:phospho-2-dehydro-3-deoxyheptonate aldolase
VVDVKERVHNYEDRSVIEDKLTHHWMLDSVAAKEIAVNTSDESCEHIDNLLLDIESQWPAVQKRDENREEVRKIFSGESDKKLIIIGPCSLDADTEEYTELFDYVEELQKQHTDVVFGVRLNGAKPRSRGGNTGLFPSTYPGRRRKQLDAYDDAFQRGLAIFTEVTDKDQFGRLAPYLTGAWLGARDMGSTDLRTVFSATRLNILVKNGPDGRISTLQDAVTAIGKNTKENDGSGVNLGLLSYGVRHPDGGPAMLSVGEGNKNVAIIARGYEIDEEEIDDEGNIQVVSKLTKEEREQKTYEHLSNVCKLAKKLGRIALLDGSHEVPRMMSFDKKDGSRFLKVLRKFRAAAAERRIDSVERIRGYLGEVSVNAGITDKNLELNDETKRELTGEFREFVKLDLTANAIASV